MNDSVSRSWEHYILKTKRYALANQGPRPLDFFRNGMKDNDGSSSRVLIYQNALNAQTPTASTQKMMLFSQRNKAYSSGSNRYSTAKPMLTIMVPEHHRYARRNIARLCGSLISLSEFLDINIQMMAMQAKKMTANVPCADAVTPDADETQSPSLSIGKNAMPTADTPATSSTRSSNQL